MPTPRNSLRSRAYTTEAHFRAAWDGEVEVAGVDDDVRNWLS